MTIGAPDTFCSAFWMHTNIRSGNQVFACCRYKTPVAKFQGSLEDILDSKEYDKLRSDSLAGTFNPNCGKCYYEESIGKISLRQKFNEQYSNVEAPVLKYLEIGFDNMCNLACDGCGPEFSSTWATILNKQEHLKVNLLGIDDIIDIPDTLEKILFLGGEPLINNRHRRFLSKIENLSNLEVTYNTNGSFLLDQKTIPLLQQCKSVEFILSLDGYKELNSAVRKNSVWEDIMSFIEQIKTLGFKLRVHTVVHRNNWFGLLDLQNFVDNINIPWTISILTHPARLDIIGLSDSEKMSMIDQVKKLSVPYDFIIKHLDQK